MVINRQFSSFVPSLNCDLAVCSPATWYSTVTTVDTEWYVTISMADTDCDTRLVFLRLVFPVLFGSYIMSTVLKKIPTRITATRINMLPYFATDTGVVIEQNPNPNPNSTGCALTSQT